MTRLLMLVQGVSFIIAALIHFGLVTNGYEHSKAGTAETVIGLVLMVGLIATWAFPESVRRIGLAAQGFALLGTIVGMFTILIGVGPQTLPDIAYHAAITLVLIVGLAVTARERQALAT